jgi:hypothetical protein
MADGMAKKSWWAKLLPDLSQVFGRFPIAALVSVALWILLLVEITNGNRTSNWEHIQGLICIFLAAGIGHLFAEGRGWSRMWNTGAAVISASAVALIYYCYKVLQTSELFLYPGLVVLLFLAPHLNRRADQAAQWQFGLRLGLATLLAAIAGVVFGVGLSSIVETLDYLLKISMPRQAHEYIWSTALGLVAPLYGMSLVPADLDDEIDIDDHRNTLLERGVSVMVNYVIVPLVVIYALIIHAYAAKIAFTWTLPRGEIGTIVCLFSAASVSAWLIAWPWREKGTWLLKQYTRFWFWLVPVPAVLLAIAVFRRISDYGVTPERYGLVLVVIWTVLLFVYLLYRRKAADMRAVIGVIAALLLAGSFGPWGAHGVTVQSHLGRLEAVFTEAGLPTDGTLDVSTMKLTEIQKRSIYSAIDALGNVNGLGSVLALLPEKERPLSEDTRRDRWTLRNDLHNKLGVGSSWQAPSAIAYNTGSPVDFTVPGATRLIGPVYAGQPAAALQPTDQTHAFIKDGVVTVSGPWGSGTITSKVVLDGVASANAALSADPAATSKPKSVLLFDLSSGQRIAVTDVYGDSNNPEPLISLTFWILLKP